MTTVSLGTRRVGRGLVATVLLTGGLALPTVPAGAVDASPRAGAAAAPCDRACLARQLRGDLRSYLRAHAKDEHVSAAGLTVRLPGTGRTIDLGAGTMRVGGTSPVRSSNVWQIGSNTKAFTSVMLLQLEAEHCLSMTDTLGKWLPQYRKWSGVTIERLLNMTSGIPSYDHMPAMLRAFAKNPHRTISKRQLVAYAKTGKPTTGYSYSNTNYILGEMIIEKITHDSYADQLQTRIIGPLHLTNTYYQPDRYPRSVTRRESAGHFFIRQVPEFSTLYGRDVSRTTLSWARGAGGIISTTHDMTVWEQALYHGRLLPQRQQRELESLVSEKTGKPIKHTTPQDPQGFGLGVSQASLRKVGRIWFYEGKTFGFRTLHLYLPKSGLIYAVALNSAVAPTGDHITPLALAVHATLAAHGIGR